MVTKLIVVQESERDLRSLRQSHFELHFAQAVAGGSDDFTVIWRSLGLAPNMQISWTPKYALNWTAEIPAPGIKVRVGGIW